MCFAEAPGAPVAPGSTTFTRSLISRGIDARIWRGCNRLQNSLGHGATTHFPAGSDDHADESRFAAVVWELRHIGWGRMIQIIRQIWMLAAAKDVDA